MSSVSSVPGTEVGNEVPANRSRMKDFAEKHPKVVDFAKIYFAAVAGNLASAGTLGMSSCAIHLLNKAGISKKIHECINQDKKPREVYEEFKKLPLFGRVGLIALVGIAAAIIGAGIVAVCVLETYPLALLIALGLIGCVQGALMAAYPEDVLDKQW